MAALAGATPAFDQVKTADSGAVEVTTQDVVLDTPATAGNLLIVGGNSDSTLGAPSGFSLAVSVVNSQAAYIWYKIAAGGETTLTVTVNVQRPVAVVAAEYSGITASAPVDVTATGSIASPSGTGPATTGTTGATAQAAELAIGIAGPHGFGSGARPISPVWGGGYTGRGATSTAFVATSSRNAAIFLGDLVLSSIGTQTISATWTNAANNWGAVLAVFKGA